ncbi:cell wall protein DAN4-like isoform X1 [Plutella xylostella]|uniref:cell wall protein DAN4-like isoform X1 n=1 Tax=Plutella xylostella TaxID=51655 RepID=UPI0020330271|nr:cell wall protein DAN4-like isoform X1 [Plutella xylostella]
MRSKVICIDRVLVGCMNTIHLNQEIETKETGFIESSKMKCVCVTAIFCLIFLLSNSDVEAGLVIDLFGKVHDSALKVRQDVKSVLGFPRRDMVEKNTNVVKTSEPNDIKKNTNNVTELPSTTSAPATTIASISTTTEASTTKISTSTVVASTNSETSTLSIQPTTPTATVPEPTNITVSEAIPPITPTSMTTTSATKVSETTTISSAAKVSETTTISSAAKVSETTTISSAAKSVKMAGRENMAGGCLKGFERNDEGKCKRIF